MARIEPVEQGRPRPADVQVAGGRRREAGDDGLGHSARARRPICSIHAGRCITDWAKRTLPFTSPRYEMIEIREATADDVPAIAEVHVSADWDTYAPLFGA